ncbi:MAG: hypothetical protein WBF04_01700 [Candidatus Sulfotelmatobacter sp.]
MQVSQAPSLTHVGTAALGCPDGRSPVVLDHCILSLIALASLLTLSTPLFARTDCLSIQEASHHIGEDKCVTGKVLRVKGGSKGVHHIDFCEDQMACPFSVVVFPSDLKDVGDVRRLAGQLIEIHGKVKLYDGRAEIILNRVGQLTNGSTMIPPLPKNYDVEKQGHYSAGRMRASKKPRKTKQTPADTATFGKEPDAETADPPD